MGFYGNVTNTSKTTFSFDLVYDTRLAMDKNADTDGVFLGRYVLIDYDDNPIKGYYNKTTDRFYNTANFSVSSQIVPRSDVIYQDLHNATDALSFYKWNASQSKHVLIQAGTPYQSRFQDDVKEYGRAYDSTVWVKRYDTTTERYKYAMIAELNAVVPTLHMIVDKPTSVPTTPYFDRDTTNIDYYLHMQSDYGMQIRGKENVSDSTEYSDETIKRVPVYWKVDDNGYQYPETGEPIEVAADIFYNNKGFDHSVRTFIDKEGYNKNIINYSMAQSGRKYGRDADQGAYTYGEPADDVYEWYVRLPGIGNAISNMWDKVYDDRGNNQKRALNKALKRQDTDDHLVSYDKNTLIGMMNTTQDLLGYHFVPINENYQIGNGTIEDDAPKITISLNYEVTGDGSTLVKVPLKGENGVADYNEIYKLIDCLFYDKPTEDNRAVTQYYHFAYTPTYTPFKGEELEEGQVYYHSVNGIWEVANNTLYKATDSNGNVLNTMAIGDYCTRENKWTLVALEPQLEDNIYSLIRLIHDIIGTDEDKVRSLDTMKGTINHIKDIIANIDTSLYPGCLLVTDPETGVIKTSTTRFPAADWDEDELLAGDGQWVSRYASVKVRENSDNANRKIPKVVTFEATGETAGSAPVKLADIQQRQEINENGEPVFNEDGTPKMIDIELISDNQRSKDGTTLVYEQAHDPNTLIFATRDKWIRLHPDDKDDSIEFEHTQSPLVDNLSEEQLNNPGYFNSLETSQKEIDSNTQQETGWLLNSKIKHPNFKVNFEEQINKETGEIEEVAIGTELLIQPDTDNLTYNSSVVDANDNRLTIPTITVDNAGHIIAASTRNFNIPHSFKKIKTSTIDDDNESKSTDLFGVSIADNINDELELAPQNRWIDIATESNQEDKQDDENLIDKITFGHRLINDLSKVNDKIEKDGVPVDRLNGERRSDVNKIPTVYRFGLPQDKSIIDLDEDFGGYDTDKNKIVDPKLVREKANTFNVPYIEIDKAGHVVAAETHTIELPENFEKITLETALTSNESEINSNTGNFAPTTLQDNITFKTGNRWLNANISEKSITFGHELVELNDIVRIEKDENNKDINIYLNKAQNAKYDDLRLSDPNIVPTVYRYGLPQDKDISMLDKDNDTEKANTFNIPYIEVDKAGHIVAAATHTVEIPDGYTTIKIGEPISDELTTDELAKAETMVANTLTESLIINPSNKWIRLKGENTEGIDTITIGHEIHTIGTSSNTTDLDVTNDKNIITQSIEYDDAGHIISKHTETWNLPYSLRNIDVTTAEALDKTENNSEVAKIKATQISDTFNFKPANNWIRLQANGHDISFGHLIQGTAATYTGTDTTFVPSGDTLPRFGDSVTLYGYQTDEAGHVIGYPTYTLTLPKGSCTEDENNGANILTSLSFNSTTGALHGNKTNIGKLLLTDYTTENIVSAAIVATDSLNTAIAKLEAQIKSEAATREYSISQEQIARIAAIETERKAREAAVETLQNNIDKEIEDRQIEVKNLNDRIDKEIEDRNTAVSNEMDLRTQADEAEVLARDNAIIAAVQAIWNDLQANYNLELKAPVIESISKTVVNANSAVQLTANVNEIENDTYSYLWNTGENSNTITVTQNGDYSCIVTRNHNGWETSSESMEITVSEIVTESETPTV